MSNPADAHGHWPFSDTGEVETPTSFRDALTRKNARASTNAAQTAHGRHDRLIVGGRAHKKQHGLS